MGFSFLNGVFETKKSPLKEEASRLFPVSARATDWLDGSQSIYQSTHNTKDRLVIEFVGS